MAEKVKCEICDRIFKDIDGLEKHRIAIHSSLVNQNNADKKESANIIDKSGSKYLVYGFGILILVIVVILFFFSSTSAGAYDSFAKCLSEKGAVMYGAFWCPHCAEQKKLFGSSFRYINYVECSTSDGKSQLSICTDEGIQSYPTWKFDGSLQQGAFSLQELSSKTGCSLTNK